MQNNSDRNERTYVEITRLTFNCKTKDCNGKASYTFTTGPVVYKSRTLRDHREPDAPEILGRLTEATPNCNAPQQHENAYQVVFFKCVTPNCPEYVMGTREDCCENKDRIFNDKREANLTCINRHTNTYKLVE